MLNIAECKPAKPDQSKPALLFVHGAWHGAWCWEEFILPHLANKGFASYAVDLRGHGESSNKGSLRFTSFGDYVEDIAEAVAKIGGPVVVIGHSMGGFAIQHFLKKHEVLGAVLMATVPWYGAIIPTLNFLKSHPLRFARINLTLSLFPFVEDPEIVGKLLLDDDHDPATREDYLSRLQDESWLAYIQMLCLKIPFTVSRASPVLVVGAEKDALFSPQSQQSTAYRYNAECVIIDGAPHNIMLDSRWQEAADAIENWVVKL